MIGTSNAQWYTVRLFFTIKITIETNTFTVDILNDAEWYWTVIEWYWTVLQVFNGIPFVVFFTIQSTIETNKFTVDVFNGIERYWTVLNGIEWYTVGRFL